MTTYLEEYLDSSHHADREPDMGWFDTHEELHPEHDHTRSEDRMQADVETQYEPDVHGGPEMSITYNGPTIRVRVSADYQASQKRLVPDVTVEVEAPTPDDLNDIRASTLAARAIAVGEFAIAFKQINGIIADPKSE